MSSLPGDWSGRIVYCAGTAWDANRGTDRHIAQRLTRYAPVLYVDPPTRGSAAAGTPELLAPGLARLTPPALPGGERTGPHRLDEYRVRRTIRAVTDGLGGSTAALVVASQRDLGGAARERVSVLYATDDFVAGAALMGISPARLRRGEARQLRRADRVVAVSPALVAKWQARGIDVELVPNGVDADHFASVDGATLPADVSLPGPIAGFVGHVSGRIDVALLEAVADRGVSLLLVGPRPAREHDAAMDRLLARPNVAWVGPKPFEALPSYLRVIDVGVVPYPDDEFNRASFPLKTLEYLAAGRAAVATDLPSVRWLDTPLIDTADTPARFADAVDHALRAPRSPELVERRRSFAREHSWDARAARFAEIIGCRVPA